MPEDITTTDDTTTAPADVTPEPTPAPYVFPFTVPTDLATVSDDDLRALHAQVREHAATFSGLSPAETTGDTLAVLTACRDLAVAIAGEVTGRRDRADEAAALADELAASVLEDEAVEVEPEPAVVEPEPVVAAVTAAARRPTAPRVRDVARTARTGVQLPADVAANASYGSLVAAADMGGFSTGQQLETFADAAKVLGARMKQYPQGAVSRGRNYPADKRPLDVYNETGRRLTMNTFSRHAGVELRRDFPEDLRVNSQGGEGHGYSVAMHAASERRLPGGSLVASAAAQVKAGKSLTAAVGWCAPSPIIYDLVELETLDGMLDAPELQTDRGGWQIPENGGPDFATIYNAIGNSGETHLTEAQVEADVAKVCTEIPCPDWDDVRLGVDYFCLTGSMLQRRGFNEIIERWSRAGVKGLAHKINKGFIAAIVAASGAPVVIGGDPSGDDAASGLLSAVDLAVEDIKSRNRMGFGATIEIVLPHWVLVQIRAAMARRMGIGRLDVTDSQILEWFAIRNAVPRFVYDWQDAFSGLATGPGGSTPLAALPSTVQFAAYPAGTWVKAVQSVVSLDTIYDSTLLATNQYTAVFVEDGWAALKMSPTSRLYTARVDPSGVVGCCPGEEVS